MAVSYTFQVVYGRVLKGVILEIIECILCDIMGTINIQVIIITYLVEDKFTALQKRHQIYLLL